MLFPNFVVSLAGLSGWNREMGLLLVVKPNFLSGCSEALIVSSISTHVWQRRVTQRCKDVGHNRTKSLQHMHWHVSFSAVLRLVTQRSSSPFVEEERCVTSLRTAAKETKPGERKKFLPRVWEKLIKKHRRGVGYNLLFPVPPSTLNQTWSVKCRELVTLTRPNKTPTIQIRHRLFTDLKVGWSAFNY